MAKNKSKTTVKEEVEIITPDEEKVSKSKKNPESNAKENKSKDVKAKDTKGNEKSKKNKTEKKSLKKKMSEVVSELKKVSKPSFGKVVKNTCVVISVVAICTLALFGVDKLFSLLYDLLLP